MYYHLVSPDREVQNVTEWAKREACWKKAKAISIPLSAKFKKELVSSAEDAEEKLCMYRKKIGDFLLAQAVMNPALQPESAQTISFDPTIRAELMHYSLRGY